MLFIDSRVLREILAQVKIWVLSYVFSVCGLHELRVFLRNVLSLVLMYKSQLMHRLRSAASIGICFYHEQA